MEHFLCSEFRHVVPIESILITKPIADAIKHGLGARTFADVKILRQYRPMLDPDMGFSAPLNRIDDMVEIMRNREFGLPPIEVTYSRFRDYYAISGGRHRLAASVILGYTHIPIIFVYA